MIEYIQLRNFQSHKETELEFHPGVNVIIGESDHGKTAIMRAFYWLIFGKPSGDSMRRWNTKTDTEVTVETAHHQITRIRGASTNQYIVDNEIYKGFGQSVPPAVQSVLNINELNFMRQMDPPFMFSKTAGEVAQYLNRLINLDVIDSSLSNIKRMHSQANSAANAHLQEAARLEKELTQLAWTDNAEVDIAAIEKKEARVQRLIAAFDELDACVGDVVVNKKKIDSLLNVSSMTKQVQSIILKQQQLGDRAQMAITLENALITACKANTALTKLPNIKGAEKAIQAAEKLAAACRKLGTAYTQLSDVLEQISKAGEITQKVLAEYSRSNILLSKAMPSVCPLCDQPIRSNK